MGLGGGWEGQEDRGPRPGLQEHTCCLPTLLVSSEIHPKEREKSCVEKAVQLAFFIINLKTQT